VADEEDDDDDDDIDDEFEEEEESSTRSGEFDFFNNKELFLFKFSDAILVS